MQVVSGDAVVEHSFQFPRSPAEVSISAPACEKDRCKLMIKILDGNKKAVSVQQLELPPARRWKIFMAPFTHIDIGFTQSQKNVLAQNLQNLKTELALIGQTSSYPGNSRFKLFTEVSWAVDEFLQSPEISAAEKDRLLRAIAAKQIEPGAFYISHQNKFMPVEAIYASLLPGLKIAERAGVPLKTACIHDVFDFSNVVKPLAGAGVKYLMVGPNDSRYVVPPLFYLSAPGSLEKILVWHTTGLNGYGENFDLKMRLSLPLQDAAFQEMEKLVSQHLKGLEQGYPTKNISAHYDYYGAKWPYPFDAFLLPYYPAQGGDNQPQNIVPSEIAKKWNEKWSSPQLIISTPQEFFEYMENKFGARIPALQGEMAGFWGEQIFWDLMQVDPQKQARQATFEVNAANAGAALTGQFLLGRVIFNPVPMLWGGYKRLILNNDHNPRPVPFGGTRYTKANVQEWMATRQKWAAEMDEMGKAALEKTCAPAPSRCRPAVNNGAEAQTRAYADGKNYALENKFYRVVVASGTGGISSIFDKELQRELVNQESKYGLNQYLVAVRGEDAGLRDYLKVMPGFKSVQIKVDDTNPQNVALVITGQCQRGLDPAEALARFLKKAVNILVPPAVLKAAAKLLFIKGGKPVELSQRIILLSGEKRIDLVQNFSGDKPQWVEHLFAYPLNFSEAVPLEYDSGYSLLSFNPAAPLGNGDLIPGAKNLQPFPSINFSLAPFQWMYGLPPDFSFNHYALMRGNGFAVAFSSRESKAIIPGPLNHDPAQGPFGGEFYHLGLGFTLWGKAGLGANLSQNLSVHSSLTSFAASSPAAARAKAFGFGRKFNGYLLPAEVEVLPSSVAMVNSWPESDSALVIRLWETSGQKTEASIKLDSSKKIKAAYLARSDGEGLASIPSGQNEFSIFMSAGEVATIRLEFAQN